MIGDGGDWLRRTVLVLATNRNTPVNFWLSLRLFDLPQWIRANNTIEEEKTKNPAQQAQQMEGGELFDGGFEDL